MIASIDNYITYGKDFILQNPEVMVKIGEMVHTVCCILLDRYIL
jgi:hypothetical protein